MFQNSGSSQKSTPSTQHSSTNTSFPPNGTSPRSIDTFPQRLSEAHSSQAESQSELPNSYRLPQQLIRSSNRLFSAPYKSGVRTLELAHTYTGEVGVSGLGAGDSPRHFLEQKERHTWEGGVFRLQDGPGNGATAPSRYPISKLPSRSDAELAILQDPSKQAENVLPRSHSATPGNSRRHSSAETPPLPINTDASSLTSYDPPDPEDPYNSLTQPKSRCPDCGSISQQPNSIGAPPDSGNSNPNPPCSTCSHRAMHHAAVASMRDSRETVSTNLGTTIGSNATISTTATTVGGGTMHASNASYPSGAMHAAVMSGEREPSEKSGPTNPTGREQAESTGSHSILSMNSMNSFPPKSTLRTEMIEKFAFMGPAVWRARWNGEPAVVKRITMAVTGVQEAADVAEAAQLVATGVQSVSHANIVTTRAANVVSKDAGGSRGVYIGLVQELCLGGTLAGLMQAGGLATPLGGVYIHRILSLLLDVARGIMHLHACGHTSGDLDPSHVWLQLHDTEEVATGVNLNSIDEDSVDTGGLAAAAAAGAPMQPPPTGGSSGATIDGCSAARMAVEFDTKWRPDYPSVAPLVDTARCVAKVAECGWCVARGCSRKTAVAASVPQAYWSPERKLRGVQGPKAHIFTIGCLMWELYVSQKPRLRPGSKRHPHLGKFPASTPLSYVVLATACMSPMACDRPSTVGIVEGLTAMQAELASKFYTDLCRSTQRTDRLGHKLDRRNLMDPSLAITASPPSSEPTSQAPLSIPPSPGGATLASAAAAAAACCVAADSAAGSSRGSSRAKSTSAGGSKATEPAASASKPGVDGSLVPGEAPSRRPLSGDPSQMSDVEFPPCVHPSPSATPITFKTSLRPYRVPE